MSSHSALCLVERVKAGRGKRDEAAKCLHADQGKNAEAQFDINTNSESELCFFFSVKLVESALTLNLHKVTLICAFKVERIL